MTFTSTGRAAAALVFALLVGPLSARDAGNAQDPADTAAPDVRTHFLALCAACHGEQGDGDGTTKFARSPRSFVEGGFSYGNTQAAIVRAMTYGIPGTPMPSFDPALSEADRMRMADYVISLGPERREVDLNKAVMVVEERPLIVRGFLPPITEGAKQQTRGLLIGTTSGTTFEYRADDVRLLGLRQGAFVERGDWTGRGGNPLKPLGKVVYLFGDGAPGATFRLKRETGDVPLVAKLKSTFVRGEEAGLEYALFARDEKVAFVTESVRSISTSVGGGFGRRFTILASGSPRTLLLDTTLNWTGLLDGGLETVRMASGTRQMSWAALPHEDGLAQYIRIATNGLANKIGSTQELVGLAPDQPREFDIATVIVPVWEKTMRATLAKELDQ